MIQIYHGEGKGKTTAAIGLCVRAVGNNIPVIFSQFLKNDSSGEIDILRNLPGLTVIHPRVFHGFVKNMTEAELEETKKDNERMLNEIIAKAKLLVDTAKGLDDICGLLVMDEALHAMNAGLLSEQKVVEFLKTVPKNFEVVITGYHPSEQLVALADYVSNVTKEKHPFDQGISARKGIEY